jgi:hypothetical protein
VALHHDVFRDALDALLADAELFGAGGACPVLREGGNPQIVLVGSVSV